MKISQKAFEKWLSERPLSRFYKGSICRCPLARFIQGQGHKRATVGTDSYYLSNAPDAPWIELPEWAQDFRARFDAQEGPMSTTFTGRQTLAVLKEVDLS